MYPHAAYPSAEINHDAIERIRARLHKAYESLAGNPLLRREIAKPALTTEKNELGEFSTIFVYRLDVSDYCKEDVVNFFRYAHHDLRELLGAYDELRRVNALLSVEQGQQ